MYKYLSFGLLLACSMSIFGMKRQPEDRCHENEKKRGKITITTVQQLIAVVIHKGTLEQAQALLAKVKDVNALYFACVVALDKGKPKIINMLAVNGMINVSSGGNGTVLHLAVQQENRVLIDKLLEVQVQVNVQDKFGFTPLLYACYKGDKEIVQKLLASGAQVAVEDSHGHAAGLLHCLSKAHLAYRHRVANTLFEALEKYRADVYVEGSLCGFSDLALPMQLTALMVAAAGGHRDLIAMLINAGCAIQAQSVNGTAPLIAYKNGHIGIVKMLIDAGADINAEDWEKRTLVCLAAEKNDSDMLDYLASLHADMDKGCPLHCAAESGHTQMVNKLLSLGLNPSIESYYHYGHGTALHMAIRGDPGSVEIVALLLKAGMNPDALDGHGFSAMTTAVVDRKPELIAKLLEYVKDPNNKLIGAVALGNWALVEEALNAGAEINKRVRLGMTPLLVAIEGGHTHIVEKLLERGATVDVEELENDDMYWESPLAAAASKGDLELISILLKAGATSVTQALARGLTEESFTVEAMLALLEAGADPEVTTDRGYTLPQWLRDQNIEELESIIALCMRPEVCDYLRGPLGHNSLVYTVHMLEEFKRKKASYSDLQWPLIAASIFNHQDVIMLLIGKSKEFPLLNTCFNLTDDSGKTALMYAVITENEELVDLLLALQDPQADTSIVDVNKRDRVGNTALYYAVKAGNLKLVNALLNKGARVQAKCIKLAAQQYDKEIMINLLFAGARTYGALLGENYSYADALLPRLFKT